MTHQFCEARGSSENFDDLHASHVTDYCRNIADRDQKLSKFADERKMREAWSHMFSIRKGYHGPTEHNRQIDTVFEKMSVREGFPVQPETTTGESFRRLSLDGDSTAQRKDMNKLECEQWPYVTRFKNVRRPFRRGVVTSSLHPRQGTDRVAEIDQAQSMQDLDDVGSVSGSTWMSFETLNSQIAKDLKKMKNLEFKGKVQLTEVQETSSRC